MNKESRINIFKEDVKKRENKKNIFSNNNEAFDFILTDDAKGLEKFIEKNPEKLNEFKLCKSPISENTVVYNTLVVAALTEKIQSLKLLISYVENPIKIETALKTVWENESYMKNSDIIEGILFTRFKELINKSKSKSIRRSLTQLPDYKQNIYVRSRLSTEINIKRTILPLPLPIMVQISQNIKNGNLVRLIELLDDEPHLVNKIVTKTGLTPLSLAAKTGNIIIVRFLLTKTRDVLNIKKATSQAQKAGNKDIQFILAQKYSRIIMPVINSRQNKFKPILDRIDETNELSLCEYKNSVQTPQKKIIDIKNDNKRRQIMPKL